MPDPHPPTALTTARQSWLRFVATAAVLSLIWEIAQIPLYTLWLTGSLRDIAFALLHCTAGDILIAAASLTAAIAILRAKDWPHRHYRAVAVVLIALALGYTMFSEWWNIEIRQAWAYRDIMPRLPGLGTGLSPVMQWIVVPLLALRVARPHHHGESAWP